MASASPEINDEDMTSVPTEKNEEVIIDRGTESVDAPEINDEAMTSVPTEKNEEVIIARRTESIDAPHILKLVQPNTEILFGKVNVNNLIEKAVLAITLVNGTGEILGHASFYDSPNLEDIDPAEWEDLIGGLYSSKYTALNTLFMHFFVAKPEYKNGCAREIICTMFNAAPEVHFCLLVVPKDHYPDETLSDYFRPLKVNYKAEDSEDFSMFATYRYEHSPVLYVRKARVEDHDDVTPLFNSMSETLKKKYGDYYVAELIEAQNEHMNCLVAEVDGYAVGLMSISDNVDLDFLNQNFDLGIFNGLRKSTTEKIITESHNVLEKTEENTEVSFSESVRSPQDVKSSQDERPESANSAKTEKKLKKKKTVMMAPESLPPEEEKAPPPEEEKVEVEVQLNLSDSHMRSGTESSLLRETTLDDKTVNNEYPESPAETITESMQTFTGEPNAFCIQLFAIDERYEMRSEDFLMSAFELFPDLGTCIITTPHLVPEFPLLQHFVRVTPRLTSILAQELYVFHKAGLFKDFKVKCIEESHLEEINTLTCNIQQREYIWEDIKQYLEAERDKDGTELQVFVAIILTQVVGVAVIRGEEDIEYLRAHYNIEDYIYFNQHQRNEHGHLFHFVLNPSFKYLTKHFIKEIFRQGHKTSLYHPLYPSYASREVVGNHTLLTCLREMVPVPARRQIQYPDDLGINAPSDRILKTMPPYALCHINKKLTLEPKVTINARIVVVGASTCGLSFLETLAYCPHLNFNNLTLVSSRGLPGELRPNSLRNGMLATEYCYEQDDLARLALKTWVNVVSGQMTGINRKTKHIVIDYETLLPFDHLILCTGKQYVVPTPDPKECSGPVPNNVFVINDGYQAETALIWLKENLKNFSGDVLIYGETTDAYCCIQVLLQLGFPAKSIRFLHPPSNDQIDVFTDPIVQTTILGSLETAGVKIFQNYCFKCWSEQNESNVTKATFECPTGFVELEFQAMFCYQGKEINPHAFNAVNDCCLVYDGFVVIDNSFHTNDSSIRAAGTVTKYKRKYYADNWVHSHFNSKEVGIALATEMLKIFDPMTNLLLPKTENVETDLVPFFRTPKITGAVLPGDYHYLHVTKPAGGYQPVHEPPYGLDLVTGEPNGLNGYFRVYLNQYNAIETVTCLSKKPFPALNFIQLYGIHERILNNLNQRYQEDLIGDLFSFFMEPWCLAIYLDRFQDIREEIRQKIYSNQSGIKDMLESFLEDNTTELLSASYGNILQKKYESRSHPRLLVESHLLSYLSYNYYHLPMYAKPGMI